MYIKTEKQTLRVSSGTETINAVDGQVVWKPIKSLWFSFMTLSAIIGGAYYFTFSAFLLFLISTAITICFGHSLGMHRRLIHNSYECPLWLEYFFVHLGVLVGMAGPIGMIYQHDLRDWAQRQRDCHPYLRHGSAQLKDAWWQLHCDLRLDHPVVFELEDRVKHDRVYQWMEKTWMLQQLPYAVLLFYIGDISWVIWGICARVSVSNIGHWLIGFYAHNKGQRDWHVNNAAVQGHNIPFTGYLTMGECWHNNHHAFPESAMLGLEANQTDPGWAVLLTLRKLGMVWNIKVPKDLADRPELVGITEDKEQLLLKTEVPKECAMCRLVI